MRDKALQLFIIFCFLHLRSEAGSCYKYLRRSKETCTGWWSRRCSTKYYSSKVCCDNYSGTTCSIPKCRGGYGTNTCNINNEGYVKYKDGKVVRNSGGVCYAPSRCGNCNKGYYPVTSSGGYCKACIQPQHCNLPVCTSSNNHRCDYCEGEYIREKPGYNVYTGKPDSKKCQKACSWVDGARCFPGTCSGNMILGRDCQCAIGFSGKDCSSATTVLVPTMLSMYLKLHGSANKVKKVDKAFKKSIIWLKDTDWLNISIQASSYYRSNIDDSKRPNYITNYYIGVEEQNIVLTLLRGTDYGEWNIDGGCTNFDETCSKEIRNISLSSIGPWRNILNNGGFKHADKIKFKVSAKNGGKVTYEDRSSFTQPYAQKHYFLNGVATNEEFELHFDVFPPVHCFEQHNDCQQDALNVTDFLTQPKFTASWNGWTDSDSGIEEYEFNIYYLENSHDDNFLEHKRLLSTNRFAPSESSATLDLEEPGPYSVELIVHDRAKNYKVARRIILYDNASVVDLYGKQARVVQVQENGWINKHTENIEIVWQNRFRNIRHSNGGWLNGVKETEDIVTDLDDSKGKSARTIDKLNNIDGIVRFDISCKVEINGISYSTPFEPVPDCLFRIERMVYTDEEIVDGKRLTYFIRGVDVFGKFAEDNVSAMIDVSPPLIQNISVRFTVSDQSAPKENELIIALEAFDYHSGMNKVSLKIFNNSTKDASINHGQSQKDLIGEVLVRKTKTIDECKDTDTEHTDGTNCYCTPYNGCYHRDIQVKTELSNGNKDGLNNGSTPGNFEYFIMVNATNNAGLTTSMQKKVTF